LFLFRAGIEDLQQPAEIVEKRYLGLFFAGRFIIQVVGIAIAFSGKFCLAFIFQKLFTSE